MILKHMDGFNADSSMHWISKALSHIQGTDQPEALYYLLSYRAEVLYYEGLFNEAMIDLDRCMPLATQMGDSLLIANIYNLKGLLHENIQDSKDALTYMRSALTWFPASPAARYPVSELHHIHGNLGSYLMLQGQLDSAGFHLQRSLELARNAHAGRARAVAHWSLGGLALKQERPDSAAACYERTIEVARTTGDHDIMLDGIVGLAEAHAVQGQKALALRDLDLGDMHIREHPDAIGLVTRRNFAKRSSLVRRMVGDAEGALAAIAAWHHMDSAITKRNTLTALRTQAELLRSDRDLALERVELERVAEDLQRVRMTRSIIIGSGSLILLALGGLVVVNARRRRKERELARSEVKRLQQEAMIAELRLREEVGRDMHDDLGAGLSVLKLKSEMALRRTQDPDQRALLRSLASTSGELIGSMRQIIWAMTPDQGSVEDLVVYIGNYARNYLDENGLRTIVEASGPWPDQELSTADRRNIFLVVKEALHNIVKHAQASTVQLTFLWDRGLHVRVADDGSGLPRNAHLGIGNGLRNMQKRVEMVGGTIKFEPGPVDRGTHMIAHFTLTTNKGSIASAQMSKRDLQE
ncbi:MAG: tetratricopeptide repeat protein [Flavobacteriales bacterium]